MVDMNKKLGYELSYKVYRQLICEKFSYHDTVEQEIIKRKCNLTGNQRIPIHLTLISTLIPESHLGVCIYIYEQLNLRKSEKVQR